MRRRKINPECTASCPLNKPSEHYEVMAGGDVHGLIALWGLASAERARWRGCPGPVDMAFVETGATHCPKAKETILPSGRHWEPKPDIFPNDPGSLTD